MMKQVCPADRENALCFAGANAKRAANRQLVHPSELARTKGLTKA